MITSLEVAFFYELKMGPSKYRTLCFLMKSRIVIVKYKGHSVGKETKRV